MKAIDVTIIIVNFRTAALTCDALSSLIAQTHGIEYEIIVIDNHSEDNSEEMIRKHLSERVIYMELPGNIGFGRANNAGIEIARGRNVLFLNPDTIVLNNAVNLLSDYLDHHPDVGVVGGNLYNEQLEPNVSFNRVMPSIFDETDQAFGRLLSYIRFGKNRLFNYGNTPLDVGFIVGADMMTRRSILEQVGAFDPDFFMYYEETELTYRIKKAGYRIVNLPQAKIIHLEGKSFTQTFDRELRSLTSRRIYFRKTHSRLYARLADLNYQFLARLAYIVSVTLRLKTYREKLKQRIAVIRRISR